MVALHVGCGFWVRPGAPLQAALAYISLYTDALLLAPVFHQTSALNHLS